MKTDDGQFGRDARRFLRQPIMKVVQDSKKTGYTTVRPDIFTNYFPKGVGAGFEHRSSHYEATKHYEKEASKARKTGQERHARNLENAGAAESTKLRYPSTRRGETGKET